MIVPIDHGLTLGPISGLASVRQISRWIGSPAIDGVIAHKGMAAKLAQAGLLYGKGVMVHLNGMTAVGEDPDTKHLLTRVTTAVRLGADAVSVQVNFRAGNHAHNLGLVGAVVDEAQGFGMPVLAMVYSAEDTPEGRSLARLRHLLRVVYELGVDAAKTGAPEYVEDIPELLDGIGEDLPVFFAGGPLATEETLAGLAKVVATSSAQGICVGRNIFQRDDPQSLLARIRELLDG